MRFSTQIAGATAKPRPLVDRVPGERAPGFGLPAPLLPAALPHGAGAADGAGGVRRAVRAAPRRHRPLQRQLATLTLPDVTGELAFCLPEWSALCSKYREVQLYLTTEIKVFYVLFERCHTKIGKDLSSSI